MKKVMLLGLLFTSFLVGSAQDYKQYPLLDFDYHFNSKMAVGYGWFSRKDMTYSARNDNPNLDTSLFAYGRMESSTYNYPNGLKMGRKGFDAKNKNLSKYKGYCIARWVEVKEEDSVARPIMMVWYPYEEHKDMKEDYRPKTSKGLFCIYRVEKVYGLPAPKIKEDVMASMVTKLKQQQLTPYDKTLDVGKIYYFSSAGPFYSTLKNNLRLNKDEISAVVNLSHFSAWPKSLAPTSNKEGLNLNLFNEVLKQKFYCVAQKQIENGVVGLFWLPPHQDYPKEAQPSPGGMFFVGLIDSKKGKTDMASDPQYYGTYWWSNDEAASKAYNILKGETENTVSSSSSASSAKNDTYYFYGQVLRNTTSTKTTIYRTKYLIAKGPKGLKMGDIRNRFESKFTNIGMTVHTQRFKDCGDKPCNDAKSDFKSEFREYGGLDLGVLEY